MMAVATGSVVSDALDNSDKRGTHSLESIGFRALASGTIQAVMTSPFVAGAAVTESKMDELLLTVVGGLTFGLGSSLTTAGTLSGFKLRSNRGSEECDL